MSPSAVSSAAYSQAALVEKYVLAGGVGEGEVDVTVVRQLD